MRNKKEDEKREDEMEVQGVPRLGGTGRDEVRRYRTCPRANGAKGWGKGGTGCVLGQ